MNKKAIILMPHFDDEIFNSVSFLLKYSGDIDIYFSHQGDCISEENYNKDITDMNEVITRLNRYRNERMPGKISVKLYPKYGEVDRQSMTNEWHKNLCGAIEDNIKNNKIEYFIIPSPSNHQAHKSSYNIGKSLLRAPYINNIENILIGTYYVDKITPNDLNRQPCLYFPISKNDLEFAKEILSLYTKNHAINPENLEVIFRYEGFCCSEEYAQAFYPYYMKKIL